MTKEQIKQRIAEEKLRMKYKVMDFKCWCANTWENNKTEIVVLAPIVLAGVKKVSNVVEKKLEIERYARTVWDPVEGHHWHVKKMNNRDYAELEHLTKQCGMSKYEALKTMGVLKK